MEKLLQLQLIKSLKDKSKNDDGSLKDIDFNKKLDASSIGKNIGQLFNKIVDKFKGPGLNTKENRLEKEFAEKQTVQILQTQTDKLDDINKTLQQIHKQLKDGISSDGTNSGRKGGGFLSGLLGLLGIGGTTAVAGAAMKPGLMSKAASGLGRFGKFALPSLGLGLLGEGSKLGLDAAADKAFIAGHEKSGKGLKVLGEASKFAGWGAGLGRFGGGIGMGIGAGVGGLIGLGKGIYRNVFSQEQRDNFDKSTTNEAMLGFNLGENDMLSADAWAKGKKESSKETSEESSGPHSQTFKAYDLFKADEDLYNEYNDRKKELEKKEYEKILSQYKNPTAHNELIASQQASDRALKQASDEFALRAEKVGAAEIHEGRDHYKNQEEAYLNRNKGEEKKKEEKSNFFTRMMDKIKYSVDKIKFNYNAGTGHNQMYDNPDFVDKTMADSIGSAKDKLIDRSMNADGKEVIDTEFIENNSEDKTVFGSKLLGKWFSKAGLTTSSLMGSNYKKDSISDTNIGAEGESATNSSIFGQVISGGLFGKDKYKIHEAYRDAEDVGDTTVYGNTIGDDGLDVTKEQYEKIRALVDSGEVDKAIDYAASIKRDQVLNSPNTGDILENQSSDVEMAKMDAQKSSTNVVNAPSTTNISNQNNNSITSASPRNDEGSVNKYLTNLWSM